MDYGDLAVRGRPINSSLQRVTRNVFWKYRSNQSIVMSDRSGGQLLSTAIRRLHQIARSIAVDGKSSLRLADLIAEHVPNKRQQQCPWRVKLT